MISEAHSNTLYISSLALYKYIHIYYAMHTHHQHTHKTLYAAHIYINNICFHSFVCSFIVGSGNSFLLVTFVICVYILGVKDSN